MPTKKLTELTDISSLTTDDILYAVNDPGGSPASRKITFQNVMDSINSLGTSGTPIDVLAKLNLKNSDAIQDAGTNAITFDGSQNVTIPNGDLSIGTRSAAINLTNTSGTASIFATVDNGNDIELGDILGNFANITIQSGGSPAITFDGSQNVTVPNGDLIVDKDDGTIPTFDLNSRDGGDNVNTEINFLRKSGGVNKSAKIEYDGFLNFYVIGTKHLGMSGVGDVLIPNGDLNFSSSNSIQDAGTNAITFDGSQNVSIPNGDLDVRGAVKLTTQSVSGSVRAVVKEDNGNGLYLQVKDSPTHAYRSTANDKAVFRAFSDVSSTHTEHFKILSDGDVLNTNGSYGTLSDRSLKQDVEPANSQWDDVKAIAGAMKKYRLKQDVAANGENARYRLGPVAQDIEKISPGLVGEDEDGIKSYAMSIAHEKAVKALGEAQERIEQLERKVATLEESA